MKKPFVFITIFIAAFLALFVFRMGIRDLALKWEKNGLPQETRIIPTKTLSASPVVTVTKFAGINLAVPFVPQAPFGDWSLPYQEACEETSAILVDKYYKNEQITPEIVNEEILKLVDWQQKRFGYYFHTTVKETATILKEYFGYKRVDVLRNVGMDDIKEHVLAGRPVIAPFAGRLLGNPYYTQPGPIYHMLVIKGVTKDGDFITNDVGTKRGQNYVYDDEVLYNALHDAPTGSDGWSGVNTEEYIKTGQKAIIVVYPNQ